MSITGNLRTMDLAELFQWLSQGKKTGTLLINSGEVEKRIYFRDGIIISTASTDPKEFLGHFLLSHGYIDEVVLARAMEMQESNRMLLGKILVTIGAIGEEELDRLLRLKSEESIFEVFTWPEGEFRFIDGELPEFKMISLSLNVTRLVLEGVKRVDDWKRIREVISSDQAVPVAVGEPKIPEGDSSAQQILPLVDDDRSIEEIALHAHSSEYQVCRVLFEQMRRGRIKIVRPRYLDAAAEQPSQAGEVDPDGLLRAADSHMRRGDFEAALRHLRAALSLDPDSRKVQAAIRQAEGTIEERIADDGVTVTAVPHLERTFEEMTRLEITPQEGFILTRVNGSYDIGTILKISPMPPLDAMLVFWRVLQAGHIRLETEEPSS